jgi:hypothetical protein
LKVVVGTWVSMLPVEVVARIRALTPAVMVMALEEAAEEMVLKVVVRTWVLVLPIKVAAGIQGPMQEVEVMASEEKAVPAEVGT